MSWFHRIILPHLWILNDPFFCFTGSCITTSGQVALWEWIHVHYLVSTWSSQCCQYWKGKTLPLLVSNFCHFGYFFGIFRQCLAPFEICMYCIGFALILSSWCCQYWKGKTLLLLVRQVKLWGLEASPFATIWCC